MPWIADTATPRPPLALEDSLLDEIEELDEEDGERFTDLDVHFGRHGWDGGSEWD